MKRSVLVLIVLATLVTAGTAQLAFLDTAVIADSREEKSMLQRSPSDSRYRVSATPAISAIESSNG